MTWLRKTIKKAGKKAAKRAASSLKSSLWDKPKKKEKALKQSEKDELSAWRFWGRSLGSLSRRLKAPEKSGWIDKPSTPTARPSSSAKASGQPARKRAKGERGPADPRFLRTQEKYENRKNDHLFTVSLPSPPSLWLDKQTVSDRLAAAGKRPLNLPKIPRFNR